MKITFQNVSENPMETIQQNRTTSQGAMPAGTASVKNAGAFVMVDKGQRMWGADPMQKGKSSPMAGAQESLADAGTKQDYMILMSHTLSEEDYAKLSKDGFPLRQMDPEETVTIVDKIKAEMAKSGEVVAGYNDDLDVATLAGALGSSALAQQVYAEFAEADLPMTEENIQQIGEAWQMASQLKMPGEGTYFYMMDNGLEARINHFYLAQNSGAGENLPGRPRYYAEAVKGYYTQSGVNVVAEDFSDQMDKMIEQSDFVTDAEDEEAAKWLLKQGVELTADNLNRFEEIRSVEFPVSAESFAKAVTNAVLEGRPATNANLADTESVYEKAVALLDRYQTVEEVRLHMTAEVNVKLLRSGFSFDTASIEDVLSEVKQAREQVAKQYFPGEEQAGAKFDLFEQTKETVSKIPAMPLATLGIFARTSGSVSVGLATFSEEGMRLQQQYAQASESYETLMTRPSAELGDSIRKAFGNVDDILADYGLDATEENRRAVRALGYNHMEITPDTIERVREADRTVRQVVEKMTPATVLKMIREQVNPLEKDFNELRDYFDNQEVSYEDRAESYSRFLYGLEQRKDITEQERTGFIGIYRMLRQIEKTDGAAVGALVNTGAELDFANLLSAVRSNKFKPMDVRVSDTLGGVSEILTKGESISGQIQKAFVETADRYLAETVNSRETENAYNGEELQLLRESAKATEAEQSLLQRGELKITPDNLLAAMALTGKPGKEQERIREKVDTKVLNATIDHLEEKEVFRNEYANALEETKNAVEEQTLSPENSSLDVRGLQLFHKQLTVMSALAEKEEYFVPMQIGEETVSVHLQIQSGKEEEKGTADIHFALSEEMALEAHLQIRDNTIEGYLTGNSPEEVMILQQVVDIFNSDVRNNTSLSMDAKLWVVDRGRRNESHRTTGRNLAEQVQGDRTSEADNTGFEIPDNAMMYRVTKLFLQSASKAVTV